MALVLAVAAPLTAAAAAPRVERDAAGRPAAVGGGAGQTRLAYDPGGRLSRVEMPGGAAVHLSYDAAGRLAGMQGPDGLDERYRHDEQGRVSGVTINGREALAIGHDGAGRVVEFAIPQGPRRRFGYDDQGRIVSVTDALGRITRFDYDARGRLSAQTDPGGARTSFGYDAQGRLAVVTEPSGVRLATSYDAQGRVVGTSGPGDEQTGYEYAADGELASIMLPGGRRVARSWNRATRTLVIRDGRRVTTRVLDAQGQVIRSTDAAGLNTSYAYDDAGRLTRVVHADGRNERLGYDAAGRLVSAADGHGSTRSYSYDRRGRLLRVAVDGRTETEFRYGAADRPIASRDGSGNETHYRFDASGRLAGAVGPSGAQARVERDAEGRVTLLAGADGSGAVFGYAADDVPTEIKAVAGSVRQQVDAAGRVTRRTDAAGRTVQYGFDTAGRLMSIEHDGRRSEFVHGADGRLLQVRDALAAQSLSYDAEGRLTGVETAGVGRVGYGFDAGGQVERVTAPGGAEFGWRYDTLRRPVALALPLKGGTVGFSWGLGGRMTGISMPNGIRAVLARDPSGRPSQVSWIAADGKALLDWKLGYDAAGRLVQAGGAGTALAFRYDAEGRLVGETRGTRQIGYAYGPPGDRTSRTDGSVRDDLSYAAGLLARSGEAAFTHDADGRLIRQTRSTGSRSYAWDALGRLVRVSNEPGGTVGLDYDIHGQLIAIADAGGRTTLAYDRGQLLQEREPGGATTLYAHAPGIDRPLAMHRGGRWFYLLTDWQGSVAAVADERGRIVARYERDAFGRDLAPPSAVQMDSRLAFHGRPCFAEIGLCWFRQRWYDPRLGRFVSPDPLFGDPADPQSLNRFAFARNAPTQMRDPTGVAPWDWKVDYALESRRTGVPESVLRDLARELFDLRRSQSNAYNPGSRLIAFDVNRQIATQADWVWHARNGSFEQPNPLTPQQAYNLMRSNMGLEPRGLPGGPGPTATASNPIAPRPPSNTPVAGTAAPADPNVVDLGSISGRPPAPPPGTGAGTGGSGATGAITEGNPAALQGPRPSSSQVAASMLDNLEPAPPAAEPVLRPPTQIIEPQTPPPPRASPLTIRDLAPVSASSAAEAGPARPSGATTLAAGLGVAGALGGVTAAAECYGRGGDARACAQAAAAGTGIGVGAGAIGIAVVETIKAGIGYAFGAAAGAAFGTTAAIAGTAAGFGVAGAAVGQAGVRAVYGSPQEQAASSAALAALDARIAELNDLSRAAKDTLDSPLGKARELDRALAALRGRAGPLHGRSEACAAVSSSVTALEKMAQAVADPARDAVERLRDAEPPGDAANDTRIAVEVVRHAVREAQGIDQLARLAADALRDAAPAAGAATGAAGDGGADADRKLTLAYNDAIEKLSETVDATQAVKTRFDETRKAASAQVTTLRPTVRSQDMPAFDRRVALIEAATFGPAADFDAARQLVRDAPAVLAASVKSLERQGSETDKGPCAALATAEQLAQARARARAAVTRIDGAMTQLAGGVAARSRKISEARQSNDRILSIVPPKLAQARAVGDKTTMAQAERLIKSANNRQATVIGPQQTLIAQAQALVDGSRSASQAALAALPAAGR